MLIDLPIEEMQAYLQNYQKLEEKVREANNLLQWEWHEIQACLSYIFP